MADTGAAEENPGRGNGCACGRTARSAGASCGSPCGVRGRTRRSGRYADASRLQRHRPLLGLGHAAAKAARKRPAPACSTAFLRRGICEDCIVFRCRGFDHQARDVIQLLDDRRLPRPQAHWYSRPSGRSGQPLKSAEGEDLGAAIAGAWPAGCRSGPKRGASGSGPRGLAARSTCRPGLRRAWTRSCGIVCNTRLHVRFVSM